MGNVEFQVNQASSWCKKDHLALKCNCRPTKNTRYWTVPFESSSFAASYYNMICLGNRCILRSAGFSRKKGVPIWGAHLVRKIYPCLLAGTCGLVESQNTLAPITFEWLKFSTFFRTDEYPLRKYPLMEFDRILKMEILRELKNLKWLRTTVFNSKEKKM